MGRTGVLRLILPLVLALPVAAQDYRRPRLDRDADTLDPRAYWAYGQRADVSWDRTRDAAYWAWRLAPNETGYLFGLYSALWARQSPAWRAEFRAGAGYVTRSREARQIDSLWPEILLRDPFPWTGGTCFWPEGIEAVAERDPVGAAVLLFDLNCHAQAIPHFERALARFPDRLWLRFDLARSLMHGRQFRAGVAQLTILLDSLRARDAAYLSSVYQSKAFFEYMIGVALLRAGELPEARAAFGRALTEDLAYWPAHARLADAAAAQGDLAEAAAEYELAVGLEPDDGVLRLRYGVVLLRAGRLADAEVQLRAAIRLEPWWMEPYGQLAVCLDRQGKAAEAAAMYRAYAERVPRRLSSRRDQALARASELD